MLCFTPLGLALVMLPGIRPPALQVATFASAPQLLGVPVSAQRRALQLQASQTAAAEPSLVKKLSDLLRAAGNRLVAWIQNAIPVGWAVRRCVRWFTFNASAQQLRDLIGLCTAAAPIASAALEAAELREVYARAVKQGACTPSLQKEVEELTRFVENATEKSLATVFATLDADKDGKLSMGEALAGMQAVERGLAPGGAATTPAARQEAVATLLEAMSRARMVAGDLEKTAFAVSVAVEGAVAAVDEDGDGQISLEEAIRAPKRIASWLVVWRDLQQRGKL